MSKQIKKPIITTSLVDQVYEYLLEQIISNELSYGDNLNIKDLSETLGISTMPVREAIKRLEYDRVVVVKPRSSCQIRTPDKTEIASIYEMRETLELFAVKKFLKNFDPSRLRGLEDTIAQMETLGDIEDFSLRIKEATALDQRFHTELCALGDNEYLCLYHRQLTLHLNMAAIHAKTYQQLEKIYPKSHTDILEPLKAQSPEALKSLEQHFDNVWAILDLPSPYRH